MNPKMWACALFVLVLSLLFCSQPWANETDLAWSTFLGGGGGDHGSGIAIDYDGNAYVTGRTWSRDFPTTAGAYDTTRDGTMDAFVAKLDPTGSALEYATLLGGSGFEGGLGIAVDDHGYAFITGFTSSRDFPTTAGVFDSTYNGRCDAFAAKLNPSGSALDYATLLGGSGSDWGSGIALDHDGNAHLTGYTSSENFPTTAGAFDETHNGRFDAFVAKLNPTGGALSYATFLGGSHSDWSSGIALDHEGNAYLAGHTWSADFPTTAGAFDTTHNGSRDAFVAKLNPTGSTLSYATFLGGGSGDKGHGIAVDGLGNVYATGWTWSDDFPTTAGSFDTTHNGSRDAFVAKLNPTGSALSYATLLGGSHSDWGRGIALDASGNPHVTGRTASTDFPTTAGSFDETYNGLGDAFVSKLDIGGDITPPEAIDDLAIDLESGPRLNGGDIRLWWTQPYDDVGVFRYVIYRSTVACSLGDSLAGTTDTTYLDVGAAGDVQVNHFYAVKAVDGAGKKSDQSNKVGEYDYNLKTTTGTDYTWIVFSLGDTSLIMASDLKAHIEANSFPATTCYTISQWNATAQSYTNYTTRPVLAGDFPLQPGGPYRIEASNDAVWILTGNVLPTESVSFQLKTTTGTDYTWISLPMHMDSLQMASDLEAHIEANSFPTTDCYTISEWNATAQAYTNYTTIPVPAGDFPIRPGRAYRVEVSADAVWPASGKGVRSFQRMLHSR